VFITSQQKFSGEDGHGCENCARQQQDKGEVTGQVAITYALRAHYLNDALAKFDTEAISNYLRGKLEWKVVNLARKEIPLADIPSLTISVAAGRRSVSKVPDKIPDTIPSNPEKLPPGGIAVLPGMSEDNLLRSTAVWGDMYGDAETIHIGDHHVALHGWEPFEVLPDVTDGRPGGLNRNAV